MNISDEEKIKLMLESMMTNVELIERNTRGLDAEALKKEIHTLSQKVGSGTTKAIGFEGLEQKMTDLQNSLKTAGNQNMSNKVSNHHYLWFFPDLKEWLQLARRGTPVIVLSVIALLLAGFIVLKYQDYQAYRDNSYKYQYLYFATDEQRPFEQFEQEWQLDSIKQAWIQWVDRRQSLLDSEIQKDQKIQQLQQQLDSLKSN
jgi:hypothetical protein